MSDDPVSVSRARIHGSRAPTAGLAPGTGADPLRRAADRIPGRRTRKGHGGRGHRALSGIAAAQGEQRAGLTEVSGLVLAVEWRRRVDVEAAGGGVVGAVEPEADLEGAGRGQGDRRVEAEDLV